VPFSFGRELQSWAVEQAIIIQCYGSFRAGQLSEAVRVRLAAAVAATAAALADGALGLLSGAPQLPVCGN
jgi:hypothetical protein